MCAQHYYYNESQHQLPFTYCSLWLGLWERKKSKSAKQSLFSRSLCFFSAWEQRTNSAGFPGFTHFARASVYVCVCVYVCIHKKNNTKKPTRGSQVLAFFMSLCTILLKLFFFSFFETKVVSFIATKYGDVYMPNISDQNYMEAEILVCVMV